MPLSKEELGRRLEFIEYWVRYMKSNPNAKWSAQLVELIDSQFTSAEQSREIYLKVKAAGRDARRRNEGSTEA